MSDVLNRCPCCERVVAGYLVRVARKNRDRMLSRARRAADERLAIALADLERLRSNITAFEVRSGVKLTEYNGPRIGEAVRVVMSDGPDQVRRRLAAALEVIERTRVQLTRDIEELGRLEAVFESEAQADG